MNETERYLRTLLQQQGISISKHCSELFDAFINSEENINNVKQIRLLQERMTQDWKTIARRAEINSLQLAFPNGIAGKPYHAEFDFKTYGLDDIVAHQLSGFEGSGLEYDSELKVISGTPKSSGDINLVFSYNFDAEADNAPVNDKKITIIVNPDPKSLWKNIPSDVNDIYAKADDLVETVPFFGHTLMAASKRGRSHANKGSFRDDDYAYAELQEGWSVMAISDGAGSAAYSRKGSQLACKAVVEHFAGSFNKENTRLLEEAIAVYQKDIAIKAKLLDIAIPHLSAAVRKAYANIEAFAAANNALISDFHATLAFVLIKRFPAGYAFLSFAVGDCPITLVDKSFEWVKPLNKLDVGEYGGGTRFVTMEEIFTRADFETRFNFEFMAEMPYVVLMSDGIYDPKFEVEANLSKPEQWRSFFNDLQGGNSEGVNAMLAGANRDRNLSDWMDFWSPGNHDDRTLIVLS